eukprot:TRINITY_DN6853_c0_g1_i2.p1 TRINITY_DN6853_c0_g1~~TRINITY_DN6853_c0_g1_i2.p1  ORF type:complete len:650 (+),score=150.06 TRINITY_DN6853_c0_g1_i2:68-1951(+)
MAAQFLDRLPPRLSPAEVQLRDHLLKAAQAAAQVLPPGDVVSLQEWVEFRMAAELELRTDSAGLVILKQVSRGAGTGKAPELSPAAQAFLSRLPGDSFLSEEERLREAIVDAVSRGPLSLAQVKRDQRVMSAVKAFIPGAVGVEDWIERRIGGEVAVDRDSPQMTIRLAGAEPVKESKESFFARLPKDSFLPEEERLRLSIFDFLAGWSSQELATLSHAGVDAGVQEARRALLGNTAASFKDWIERRIGGELSLKTDRKGQYEIHLSATARPFVAERVAALRAGTHMPPHMPPPMHPPFGPPMGPPGMMHPMPPPPQAPPMRPPPGGDRGGPPSAGGRAPAQQHRQGKDRDVDAEAAKARFFEKLPAEELLETELELRQLILDFLDRQRAEHPGDEGPMLSDIGKDKDCRKLRGELLQGTVSLREWVDRRIGGEVATKTAANGQVIVMYRDGMAPEPAQDAAEAPEADGAEAGTAEGPGSEAKVKAFFDGLPPDGFLPEEEALREALLNFLETWTSTDPPTLAEAQNDTEVHESRAQCLPKSSGVSLKQWIDRRIGGEIATWRKDGRAKDISWGLRDAWGDVANEANQQEAALAKEAASGGRKRKADDQGKGGERHRNLGGKGGGRR